ncbi:hypothetical protein Tco_1138029 [Tanacetum coccineum]
MPELTSHGGTMVASLRHQWRDTICGYGAYGCILAQPHFFSSRQMPPRRNRVNTKANPDFVDVVEQAVATLLPTLTAWITDQIRSGKKNLKLSYFPYSKKEKCEREYKLICQLARETSTDFIKRFLRLTGFLGAKAGTQEEQAKHFKCGLNDFVLDMILNTEFTDVAQVANAARNIEIFRDRPKNEGDNKRDRDGHHIRPSKTPSRVDDRRDSDRYGNRGRHGNRDKYGNYKVIDRAVTDMVMVVTDREMVVRRCGMTKINSRNLKSIPSSHHK